MNIVYFLQRANGDIKIGFTSDYRTRLSALIVEHGDLTLLGVMMGGYDVEAQLHKQFSDYRIGRTEFFTSNDNLLTFIKQHSQDGLETLTSHNKFELRLPDEMMEALKAESDSRGTPVASIIREAVQQYFKAKGVKVSTRMNWGGKREKK